MAAARSLHTPAVAAPPTSRPEPLENGERLSAPQFLRRYHAMPNVNKAELIDGIVYMPSPVNQAKHGEPHVTAAYWIATYRARTPGVVYGDNSTIHLDLENIPQPDLLLRISESAGGRSRIDDEGYLHGPPELLIEIASSSTSIDLNAKLHAYRRNGVPEYLVWRVREEAVTWLRLIDGQYVAIDPDPADGLLKSSIFPGLWLDADALLKHDLPRLVTGIDRGTATTQHHEFAARITVS